MKKNITIALASAMLFSALPMQQVYAGEVQNTSITQQASINLIDSIRDEVDNYYLGDTSNVEKLTSMTLGLTGVPENELRDALSVLDDLDQVASETGNRQLKTNVDIARSTIESSTIYQEQLANSYTDPSQAPKGVLSETKTVEVAPSLAATKATSFSDVSKSDWFYNSVMKMAEQGYVSGVTEPVNGVGKYDPSGKTTVGAFIQLGSNILGGAGSKGTGHWAEPAYINLENKQIDIGFANSQEALNSQITREDMCYILVQIAEAKGEQLTINQDIKNNPDKYITDFSSVSWDRENAVIKALSNGLMNGNKNGTFNPQGTTTRAELAQVYYNLLNPSNRIYIQAIPAPSTELVNPAAAGEYKDCLKPAYADKVAVEAISLTRTGKDANGFWVQFTAPNLDPSIKASNYEFVFYLQLRDKDSREKGGTETNITLSPGQTSEKIYMETVVDSSLIKGGSISLAIRNSDSNPNPGEYAVSHRYFSNNDTAIKTWDSTGRQENIPCDYKVQVWGAFN